MSVIYDLTSLIVVLRKLELDIKNDRHIGTLPEDLTHHMFESLNIT